MSEGNADVGNECPNPEVLAGFMSGGLPAALLTSVAEHLATCNVCVETMRGLHDSDDSLIDNLRRYVRDESALEAATAPAPATDSLPTQPETTAVESGPTPDERSELNRPRTFGNYELLSVLGEGGMGIVYKARQKRLDWLVALKVIKAGIASSPEARARFALEGKAVARLRHPHVVRIHDSSEVEGQPYYAMELLEGGSLKDRLGGKQQPERAAAQRVRALALGVHAAHQENIIHRDLKPGNVLLDNDGNAKVSDFGLAKLMDADQGQTLTDAVLGTPPYMAPEQARGDANAVGFHTDVYALGAILYEMLTGRPPFLGANRMETLDKVRREPPLPPARLRPGVNPDLEAVCLTCLEKDPARRYPSAQALADDLGNYLEEKPTRARPLSWHARAWRTMKRHAVAACAFTVVLLATAAGFFYLDPDRPVRRIEQRLAEGKKVDLFPDASGPGWLRLQTGQAYSQVSRPGDGTLSISTWGLALCELVRDPQVTHYQWRVEVRNDLITWSGQVGIYFAHRATPTTKSVLHTFMQMTFDDFNDVNLVNNALPAAFRSPPAPGNSLNFDGHLFAEEKKETLCDMNVSGLRPPLVKPVREDNRPWHTLVVEITPDTISASWDGKPVGKLTTEVMEQRMGNAWDRLQKIRPEEFGARPAQSILNLSGGLGLYVFKASASFRAGAVEPMPLVQ
jgi:serine/threonine-protein kinase